MSGATGQPSARGEATPIPKSIGVGESKAAEQLLPLVYEELRKLATSKMGLESPGHTLQATALVHEAWLRLAGKGDRKWNDRTHFFAAAAQAMRLILVDNARRKRAVRHGGGQQRVELPAMAAAVAVPDDDQILAVDEVLGKFAAIDPQKAELVKLRYFVGMTIEEAAQALDISQATAKRYWAYARAWLAEEIRTQQNRPTS